MSRWIHVSRFAPSFGRGLDSVRLKCRHTWSHCFASMLYLDTESHRALTFRECRTRVAATELIVGIDDRWVNVAFSNIVEQGS